MTFGHRSTARILFWVGLAALAGVGLGFEAGRRYPFEFLRRTSAPPPAIPSPPTWTPISPLDPPRYENQTAVVGGRLYTFGGFVSWPDGEVTPRVDRFDPATGQWSRLADLPKVITHRQAAVVGDTVWFAGGFLGHSPGQATNEVWGYNPAEDRWFPGPPLPSPRAAGALVWNRGRLHYFGGFASNRETPLGDHLVLELTAVQEGRGEWRRAAPVPVPRGHLGGVALDGYLYALGGTVRHDPRQASRRAVHRYDPVADRWTEVSSLPTPRSHFEAATFTFKDQIWIVGGWNLSAERRAVGDISVYDPRTDRWTTVLRLPHDRVAVTAAAIGDSLFFGHGGPDRGSPADPRFWLHRLVPGWLPGESLPVAVGEAVGGVIGERLFLAGDRHVTLAYDFRTARWAALESFAARPAVEGGHGGEVLDDRLILVGGATGAGRLVQIFQPARNEWSFGPDLPFETRFPATAVIEGRLYVAGGLGSDTAIGSAARYDPGTGTWTELPPMPLPRAHAGSGTDGRRFYIFGGRPPTNSTAETGSREVQIYDPATGTWSMSGNGPDAPAPLPEPRTRLGKAVAIDGKLWMFGGLRPDSDAAQVVGGVEVYDPTSNSWSSTGELPTPRFGALPVAYGGHVYVAGGGPRPGNIRSRSLEILRLPDRE